MSNLSTVFSETLTAINAATAAGNTGLATQLAALLHIGNQAPTTGLDFKGKTMTVTYYQNNPATAVSLMAQGWTIIPG